MSLQALPGWKQEGFMPNDRDTYKYQFVKNRKIVHGGITNDLLIFA